MDESFWEAFCYYFALDYENFRFFFHKWFSIRGITKHFNINFPQPYRIYISVPLLKRENVLVRSLSTDTEFSRSSLDEVDVHYEGSLASDSFSSCGDNESQNSFKVFCNNNVNSRTTPDIVRTICRSKLKNNLVKSDSIRSLADSEVDHGFQSDVSVGTGTSTYRKLEELQEQFAKMQKDIAGLVQFHSLQESAVLPHDFVSSLFTPIMSSSPSVKPRSDVLLAPSQCVPPPPPCVPPPPPAQSSPMSWKQALFKSKSQICSSAPRRNLPDMSEVLKGISSVKLRPVRPNERSKPNDSKEFSFVPRVPLRSVTRHESIVAVALRERFQQFRMLSNSEDSSAAEIADDWSDDADNSVSMTTMLNNNRSDCNVGRALLRKVDRSKLPETVSKDFMDKSLSNTG